MNLEDCRPEVQAFALAMEKKLQENDHKPGWKNDDAVSLFKRAGQEFNEADERLALYLFGAPHQDTVIAEKVIGKDRLLLLRELVDVANFLMMTADVCGCLEVKE